MTTVFGFNNYRKYIEKRLNDMPNRGYGQMSELSRFLNVHVTLVSQILKGHKDLTTDQAAMVCEFFGLGGLETDYFIFLVSLERAGTPSAKRFYKEKIQKIKEQSQEISERIPPGVRLTDEARAVFYSEWTYSAIRQAVALPRIRTLDDIAKLLDLPIQKVKSQMNFLLLSGLCNLSAGRYCVGASSTHLESSSPWVNVHHANWRNRAIQSLAAPHPADLHYSCPATLSIADTEKLKESLLNFVEEFRSTIDPSPSETMHCLNLDWFKIAED